MLSSVKIDLLPGERIEMGQSVALTLDTFGSSNSDWKGRTEQKRAGQGRVREGSYGTKQCTTSTRKADDVPGVIQSNRSLEIYQDIQ